MENMDDKQKESLSTSSFCDNWTDCECENSRTAYKQIEFNIRKVPILKYRIL